MENGRPVFGNECLICLRCVYGCPQKALYSPHYSLFLIKDGFSLDELEGRRQELKAPPEIKIKSGFFYKAVKKYLEDIDF